MHKNVFGRITLKKLQCFANVRSIGCVINQNASSCKKPNYIVNTRQFSVPKIAKPGTFDPLAMEIKDIDGVYRKVRYIDVGVRDDPNPIVMLGGTAQTIDTFGPHLRSISRIRRLIIPELRCQGSTELLSSYCTMEQQVEDFDAIMHNLGIIHVNDAHGMKINKKIDIVGFSFGGRVAMSLAAYRKYINRLSVTGVPYTRYV